MAESTRTSSQTVVLNSQNAETSVSLTLTPPANDNRSHISWSADTVDNEHLNKKKSKCCCVYHPQKEFKKGGDDSSSSDEDGDGGDDCTNNCQGHKSKCYKKMDSKCE